jgi:hypothetical protein
MLFSMLFIQNSVIIAILKDPTYEAVVTWNDII